MLYSGCFVSAGNGQMLVTGVGNDTEFGQIAQELSSIEKTTTPLQEKLDKLGKQITVLGASAAAIVDVGIAMGGLGSDAAIEAADVVLMTDEPSKVGKAIEISKKTMKIVKENIIFAIAVKVIVLVLGACGVATMWEAVFADVGVSILAILNSLRMLRG